MRDGVPDLRTVPVHHAERAAQLLAAALRARHLPRCAVRLLGSLRACCPCSCCASTTSMGQPRPWVPAGQCFSPVFVVTSDGTRSATRLKPSVELRDDILIARIHFQRRIWTSTSFTSRPSWLVCKGRWDLCRERRPMLLQSMEISSRLSPVRSALAAASCPRLTQIGQSLAGN